VAAKACLAGVLTAILATACGGGTPSQQKRVLSCLRAAGWDHVRGDRSSSVVRARDGHASVELRFFASSAAARRSLPQIAPIGDGWLGNVSFRSTSGFTFADEQAVERCLAGG
jgi:hypothetical protein